MTKGQETWNCHQFQPDPATPADLEARSRAMRSLPRLGESRVRQVESMLKDRPLDEVARFVCGCFQDENLQVKPWQPLPCNADLQWLAQEEDPPLPAYWSGCSNSILADGSWARGE